MSPGISETNSGADSSVPGQLVSASQLAQRWECSQTTVRRLARRAGLTRVLLGDGANGTVRYVLEEVERYERTRSVRS